ncbi:hypothetical protein SRHO_G00049000 [Serrasalmus rhombeus]
MKHEQTKDETRAGREDEEAQQKMTPNEGAADTGGTGGPRGAADTGVGGTGGNKGAATFSEAVLHASATIRMEQNAGIAEQGTGYFTSCQPCFPFIPTS